MQTCPSCKSNISERAIYCSACGSQVRCKECSDILEQNARFCSTCGTRVGEAGIGSENSNGTLSNHAVNTIDFEETTKGRSLRASLTDTSVDSLSNAFGMFIGNRSGLGKSPERPVYAQDTSVTDQAEFLLPAAVSNAATQDGKAVVETTVQVEAPLSGKTETDVQKLRRIFQYNGEQLRLMETRLKANSKLDAARRLTYLFLYAHQLEGREQILRTELNDMLKKATLYDSNSASWITKSPDLIVEGEMVGLRLPGQEQAQNILAEVLDPNIPNEWNLGTGRVSRSTKSGAKGDGEAEGAAKSGNGKGRGNSKAVSLWVAEWKALSLPVDGHSAIKDCSVEEKGIFGLWAIRKATSDVQKVVSGGKLTRFLYEAFEIKVDGRGLERSLKSISGKGILIKVQGGFQLQPPGMEEAEKMAGLNESRTSTTTSP